MCDEFSMLIATFIVFYRLLSFSQTLIAPRILLGGLSALMLVVIVAQVSTGESTVQQIVFTGMVYWLWHMCFKLIGNFDSEEIVRRKMRWMAVSGIGTSFSTLCISEFPNGCEPDANFISHSFLCDGTRMLGDRLLCL
jgi:Ceramidase